MPKIVDHDRYRKELLLKSFDLLAEKGYAAITMRQIAQGLGVSTGTLYHYFPSKEALFEQLVEELCEVDILNFSSRLTGKDLTEQTIAGFALFEEHRDYFLKQTLLMTDFYQHQRREGKDVGDVFKRVCDQAEKTMSVILGIDDPQILMLMMSLVDGLLMQELYGHRRVDYQSQAKLLSEMLTLYFEKHQLTPKNYEP
ncbi:TetR/AcrR family transcriptional regulator [Leptolyngbya sp. NIES-2104]|uniref:TetR/AcrR family transcriptional regulator n=1 Tax=Leptolyngbya sp. NIES-2104 TaxID=1552121 RepID=UPI0006EC54D4|nr:TetR/AcrR family transcriptional regulator [Leptolyngbya sp. NIES-2104]GAP96299.1 transcriptional regulator, TetR family [Leptolyngbya sp. NIES-2104]